MRPTGYKLIPGTKEFAEAEHKKRLDQHKKVFCQAVTKECETDCPYRCPPLIVNKGTVEMPYWMSQDCYCTQGKMVVTM